MAKKVEHRYAAMADLAAALTDHLRNKPAAPGEASAPTPTPLPAPEAATEDRGIRVSQMGGLRSAAQFPVRLPAPKADGEPRRRHRRKKAARPRVAPWVWLAGAGVAGLMLLLGWIIFRGINSDPSRHGTEGQDAAARPFGDREQGFQPLLNGKDLSGWVVESGARQRW